MTEERGKKGGGKRRERERERWGDLEWEEKKRMWLNRSLCRTVVGKTLQALD